MPKNGYNTPFWGIFGGFGVPDPILAIRGGCFYINPSRRGPVAHFRGFWGVPRLGGISGSPGTRGGDWYQQGSPGGPGGPLPAPAGDRAPARGVDVKPPPRGSPGTPGAGPRAWKALPWGAGEPPGLSGDPSGPGGSWRSPDPGSGPLPGGCFTSTPRGGALSPSRRPRGPGGSQTWGTRVPPDGRPLAPGAVA